VDVVRTPPSHSWSVLPCELALELAAAEDVPVLGGDPLPEEEFPLEDDPHAARTATAAMAPIAAPSLVSARLLC
jgi:hypothetical protein